MWGLWILAAFVATAAPQPSNERVILPLPGHSAATRSLKAGERYEVVRHLAPGTTVVAEAFPTNGSPSALQIDLFKTDERQRPLKSLASMRAPEPGLNTVLSWDHDTSTTDVYVVRFTCESEEGCNAELSTSVGDDSAFEAGGLCVNQRALQWTPSKPMECRFSPTGPSNPLGYCACADVSAAVTAVNAGRLSPSSLEAKIPELYERFNDPKVGAFWGSEPLVKLLSELGGQSCRVRGLGSAEDVVEAWNDLTRVVRRKGFAVMRGMFGKTGHIVPVVGYKADPASGGRVVVNDPNGKFDVSTGRWMLNDNSRETCHGARAEYGLKELMRPVSRVADGAYFVLCD